MRSWPWPWLLASAILAVFLATGVRHLDTVPQVYEDEPWQASTGYKLATQRGSDLFAGFFHMDQRYYGFMPLHPLLLAATFKLSGLGLAQARLETVVLTALTLILTFALGLRLFNAWVGALAVGLLVLVRWTGFTYIAAHGHSSCRLRAHCSLRPSRARDRSGRAARVPVSPRVESPLAVRRRRRAVRAGPRLRLVLGACTDRPVSLGSRPLYGYRLARHCRHR